MEALFAFRAECYFYDGSGNCYVFRNDRVLISKGSFSSFLHSSWFYIDETRESIPSSMLDSEWWQAIVAIHQQQIANNYVAKLVIIF